MITNTRLTKGYFENIFQEYPKKFPQLNPERLINAVIKHNFTKYYSNRGGSLPYNDLFYVGATALFEEYNESAKTDITFEDFFQNCFTRITKEMHGFLKYECPEIRTSVLFIDKNEGEMSEFLDNAQSAYDSFANKEALEQFFMTMTPKTKALFEYYLLGYEGEEIANKFKISPDYDAKTKLGTIKTRFRLSIEKARRLSGVPVNAPIHLHDNYDRQTITEKREKASIRTKKYRDKLKTAKLIGA